MSLPSPLTASEEWLKPRDTTLDTIRLTAGLHRQVWVSGASIYVDVHIANDSRKTIKKIELQLERDILCYRHVCYGPELYELGLLMKRTTRQLPLRWKNRQAKLGYSTAMKERFLAKPSSNRAPQGGMGFPRAKRMFARATSRCRGDTRQ